MCVLSLISYVILLSHTGCTTWPNRLGTMVSGPLKCPPLSSQTHSDVTSLPGTRHLPVIALETHLLLARVLAAGHGSLAFNNVYFCTFEIIWYVKNFSLDIFKQNDTRTVCSL